MKKQAIPKPSELLKKALALFGPKGENWIKDEENKTLEAGFLYKGERLDADEAQDRMLETLEETVRSGGNLVQTAKQIKKLYKSVPQQETFCSIGVIHHIDTPNEEKAADYLAMAIKPTFDPNADNTWKGADGIIVEYNDKKHTTFPMVREAFQKAIKLAQTDGN